MDPKGFLNVFRGPNAVAEFYNPDLQPPLPLIEIPVALNPFHGDGVKIYAKMMTALPAHNVKSLPGKFSLPTGTRFRIAENSHFSQHSICY